MSGRTGTDSVPGVLDGDDLLADGVRTRATLVSLARTGDSPVGPVVDVELRVAFDDGDVVVHHRQAISREAFRALKPGGSLAVRVDPADRSRLIIA